MASLWKHPKSKFWTACFTDHTGKQRKKSTKETDRKKALKLAELLESEYRKTKTAGQMQKLLLEVHREVTGTTIKQVSLADYQTQWVEGKKAEGCAESSRLFYEHSTGRFVKFMGEAAAKPIGTITQEDVEQFRNSLTGKLAAKTISHQIKGLRMLFKAAMEAKLIETNPAGFVKTAKAKAGTRKQKEAFSMDQIRQLLPFCDDDWRGITLLGLYSGQRLADVQHLTWSDVSGDCSLLTLTARKTGRRMTIPTAPSLRSHLMAMPRPQEMTAFLHPKAAARKTNTLSGQFSDLLIKAGIRQKNDAAGPRDHSGLSFHSLRHTSVTSLKEAGIPLAVVMELIGHESEAMSQNYTKVGNDALEKAAAAFPTL